MYHQWNRGITKGNISITSLPQIKSQLKNQITKKYQLCAVGLFSVTNKGFSFQWESHILSKVGPLLEIFMCCNKKCPQRGRWNKLCTTRLNSYMLEETGSSVYC